MKLIPVARWLRINLLLFVPFFFLVGILVSLFPEVMLSLFGKWALVMQAVGARSAGQFTSHAEMFRHILTMNAVTLVIIMVVGLLMQAPLAVPFLAAFYGLVAFLAPDTIGRSFGFADWLLITVESFTLILGTAVSSGLAADLYGVGHSFRGLVEYWKKSWKRLLPTPVPHWRDVFREWQVTMVTAVITLAALSVFVAWFETYGY
jgi:hypothetical protein